MDYSALNAAFAASLADSPAQRPSGVPKVITATIEFELLPENLADYAKRSGQLPKPQDSDVKDLNVLRARHHGVARLLAAGLAEGIVAELTNFSTGYIGVLKNSPSFVELLAHYRSPGNSAAELIAERLRVLGTAATERLLAKIEADELDANQLLAAAKLGHDRSGNGPQSTQHNINEHRIIDVAEIAKLTVQAREANRSRITDISQVRQVLPSGRDVLPEPPAIEGPNHA